LVHFREFTFKIGDDVTVGWWTRHTRIHGRNVPHAW
jgi:hypothetical protein